MTADREPPGGVSTDELLRRYREDEDPAGAPGAGVETAPGFPLDREALLAQVREEVTPATSFLSGFGTSLVAHTGPGLVGLAWYWEE